MDNQKQKRSNPRRAGILLIEGLLIIAIAAVAFRLIAGNNNDDTATVVQATVAAVEAELQATIDAQALLLNATPALDTDLIRARAADAAEMGNTNLALAEYTRLLELDPTDADTYYARGSIHYDNEDWALAINDFTLAIEHGYEQKNFVYFYRGFSYSESGEYQAAVADYTRSIEADPDCEDACWIDYNNRGVSYDRADEFQNALVDYNMAIELNPDYALAYNNRGYLHEKLENIDRALLDWNRALILRQESVDTRDMSTDSYSVDSSIDAPGHQVQVVFEGQAGSAFSAETERSDTTLDPILLLRDADGQPLAFNDDRDDDTLDALIDGFELPADGTYTLVTAAGNGRGTGDFTLTIALAE